MGDHGLVSSGPSWTWVLKEKQCLVSWEDNEEGEKILGELSPVNQTSNVTINIGTRGKELLMVLHLPISSRRAKHPRDMFMIIPNTFDTSNLDKTFEPVQSAGRADLDNAGFAYCNLFHIPVTVAEPCDVVMPQTKRHKPLKGTTSVLATKLKSLSETKTFDIFCRFDTFAQVELRKIFSGVSQFEEPLLLLDSMYEGHGAGVNLWHLQGLDLDPEGAGSEPCAAQQQDLPLPPPYTSHITPPQVSVQVPCSDPAAVHVVKDTGSAEEAVPESSPGVRTKRAANPLSAQRRVRRISPFESLIPTPCAPATELDCAFLETQHDARTPAYNLEESSWCPFASTPVSIPPDWTEEMAVALHHDANLSFDRAEEISVWLYSAWKVLPSAHHELRAQLLALGAADDANTFAQLRVDCSTKLAFAAALAPKQEPNKLLLTETSDAQEQVREVVEWANGVRSDADTVLVYDLAALARAAMDVVDSSAQEKKEGKMGVFLVHKARCIAFACGLGRAVMTV